MIYHSISLIAKIIKCRIHLYSCFFNYFFNSRIILFEFWIWIDHSSFIIKSIRRYKPISIRMKINNQLDVKMVDDISKCNWFFFWEWLLSIVLLMTLILFSELWKMEIKISINIDTIIIIVTTWYIFVEISILSKFHYWRNIFLIYKP